MNCTAAPLKRTDPRTWFGRGTPLGRSMAMIQRNGRRVSMPPRCKQNPMCKPIVHRVGGCIPREFCKLRSEKRRKETRRCGKHYVRRKPACPITSAAWHSRELHLKLNLNEIGRGACRERGETMGCARECEEQE